MKNRPNAILSELRMVLSLDLAPQLEKKSVFILARMIMIMFTKLHSVYLPCFIVVQVLHIFLFLDLLVFDLMKLWRVHLIPL